MDKEAKKQLITSILDRYKLFYKIVGDSVTIDFHMFDRDAIYRILAFILNQLDEDVFYVA